MKKTYRVLIFVSVCAFLFIACEQTGVSELELEKAVSGTSSTVESAKGNDNDEKQPPIVPPEPELPGIPFQVGASRNHSSDTKGHALFTIARSKEDLNRAAETRYHQYWTNDGGPYNVYYLADITEQYDDEFFAENALVLYLFGASNTGGGIKINQIQRQDDTLTLITDFHEGMMTALSYWTVVIEVAQADVYGVTALENKNECVCPPPPVRMISVVLTNDATVAAYYANKTYTPVDFPEFNFSRVENLFTMQPTGPQFRRILFLYLAEPIDRTNQDLLQAVNRIGQRTDVFFAELD